MRAPEKIVERIRKCLRLAAPDSGATPAERDTAKRMADALMKQYKVKERDLAPKPGRDGHSAGSFDEVIITVTPIYPWQFAEVFRKHMGGASRSFKKGGECFACGHGHLGAKCRKCGCEEVV